MQSVIIREGLLEINVNTEGKVAIFEAECYENGLTAFASIEDFVMWLDDVKKVLSAIPRN